MDGRPGHRHRGGAGRTARDSLPGCDFVDVEALGLWPDLNAPSSIDALSRIIAPYDRVVISCQFERRPAWATFLKSQDVGGEILLDRDLLHGAVAIGAYGAEDTLVLSRGPLSLTSGCRSAPSTSSCRSPRCWSFAPLMLVVAVLIKLESRGPIFFRQVRVGEGNRSSRSLKFRSMRLESTDSDGNVSTQRDDPRITRVGKIHPPDQHRRAPQLFNVLRGDMSIVGPRPHALGSLAGENLFWEVTQAYWIRHALKAGHHRPGANTRLQGLDRLCRGPRWTGCAPIWNTWRTGRCPRTS
jgi:hypothetical protein